jgi:hypothetical protein
MKSFHLTRKGDRWELHRKGGVTIATYESKSEAVAAAQRIVAAESGSLRIHNEDGTIGEERTYPQFNDPANRTG